MENQNMFLGVDLSKLPEEVRLKMTTASSAHKRYQLAREQQDRWNSESETAARAHTLAQQEWNECLNRWDPDTNTLKVHLKPAPEQA
jgi:hypothetical protein